MPTKTRIQLRRGNLSDLPTLLDGEAGFALDTATLYIGSSGANFPINAGYQNLCQGRLTFLSNTPVVLTDISLATSLYFTPYNGNQIGLYYLDSWRAYTFTQLTFDLRAFTWTYNVPYDVFIFNNSGTLTLTITQWTSDTTRSVALRYQDGVLVRTDNANYRYLGTVYGGYRAGYTGIYGYDTLTQRYLYNHYNQVIKYGFSCPNYSDNNAATTYTVALGTTMVALTPYIEFVSGHPNGAIIQSALSYRIVAGAAATAHVGIGLDAGADVRCATVIPAATQESGNLCIPILVTPGYHSLRFKAGAVTAAATFTADDGRFGAAADVPVSFLTLVYYN